MPVTQQFKKGDRVVHTRRPEWGPGVIDQAATTFHDGSPAQRVVVNFANYGRITLNTAVAILAPAPATDTMLPPSVAEEPTPASNGNRSTALATRPSGGSGGSGGPAGSGGVDQSGWLAKLTGVNSTGSGHAELWRLPDAMTDPFQSPAKRLLATLESYRFTADSRDPNSQRGILDWAVAQTGLADPLSKYSRPELEAAFPRFARDRDDHLWDLIRLIRKQGKMEILGQVSQEIKHPAARAALDRVLRTL